MPTSSFNMFARARIGRVAVLLLLASILFSCTTGDDHAMHKSDNGEPVNYLVYDSSFSSAGMPDAAFIKTLAAEGVDIVVNVAPHNSSRALKNEPELVANASMTYLNIPVDWNKPTQEEVSQFLSFMQANADAKIFLHCQMNMRATAYAMLHRVINEKLDPEVALLDMHKIWEPNATWAKLMNTAFENHNVDYTVAVPNE